nr:alpha/beta fold hydrolase [Streptomyces virginiae]
MRWATAHTEWLEGASGRIEAIVYGGSQWRSAPRLLIALHGGPESAWRFEFDPMFQRLSRSGIAVVAPNQRGSQGYGRAHKDAIRGAWGGPDLDDICHIARTLSAQRRSRRLPPLLIYGSSYGGYLALLASARCPEIWSHCAVFSAFTSPQSLHADGSDGVRSFLKRLHALPEPQQPEKHDAAKLAAHISARILIVHGHHDDVVPVSQARRLRSALRKAGRTEGKNFQYAEVKAGHDPLSDCRDDDLSERLTRFFIDP